MRINISFSFLAFGLLVLFPIGVVSQNKIQVQNLEMNASSKMEIFKEELLHGAIAETRIEHITLIGPVSKKLVMPNDSTSILLFIKGNATLKTGKGNMGLCLSQLRYHFLTIILQSTFQKKKRFTLWCLQKKYPNRIRQI